MFCRCGLSTAAGETPAILALRADGTLVTREHRAQTPPAQVWMTRKPGLSAPALLLPIIAGPCPLLSPRGARFWRRGGPQTAPTEAIPTLVPTQAGVRPARIMSVIHTEKPRLGSRGFPMAQEHLESNLPLQRPYLHQPHRPELMLPARQARHTCPSRNGLGCGIISGESMLRKRVMEPPLTAHEEVDELGYHADHLYRFLERERSKVTSSIASG